jgi:HlyD family secretion protein
MKSITSTIPWAVRRGWLLLGAAALLAGAALVYIRYFRIEPAAAQEETVRTAVIRTGDLILRASGTGSLISMDERELGFGTSGTVAELKVQLGDLVQAGDVLALQGDRDLLQAELVGARLDVLNAQQALDSLYARAGLTAAQALLDLANAQQALQTAHYTWNVQQQGHRASQLTVKTAEAKLVLAQAELDRAKQEYDRFSGRGSDDQARALALTRLAAAQQSYDSALRSLNWYTGKPSEIEQTQLDANLAMAEAEVALAQQAYEEVKDGPAQDLVARAELELASAEIRLAVAEANLVRSIISAPIDGTITALKAAAGDSVSGAFITLADLSRPYLEVFFDETDLDKLKSGYDVEVVFDALPDDVFLGTVILVDPSLTRSGNVSAMRGVVRLDPPDGLQAVSLPIGLSAAVDVIAGRAEAAVLAPAEALREIGPGEYVVFVMEDGEPRLRPVEIGLVDFTYVEILSGLQPGDVVTTGIVETGG